MLRIQRILLIGAKCMTLLVAAFFVACSEESYPGFPDTDKGNGEAGVNRYFSMQILSADDNHITPDDSESSFQGGSEFEHAMDVSNSSSNVVIFFNDDWTYFGYTTIDYDRYFSQGTHDSFPSEASYIGVIHSPNPELIYGLPQHGLLVLNAHNICDALDQLAKKPGATIDDVLELTDEATGSRRPGMNGSYHTMTSTIFLEPDGNSWRHSALFHIDRQRIYETRVQAAVSPAATAIVERMAAKFSISFPGAGDTKNLSYLPDDGRAQLIVCNYSEGQANYNNRKWTCSVEAWGINKYETSSYYFRNILGNGADVSSYPYSYESDINTTGRPFYNGWNRANYHRALWGKDPHYDEGVFPRQYRPAVDNPELEYYGYKGNPSLGYVSYNELSSDFSGLGTTEGTYLYSSENTFPDTRINDLWQHDLCGSEMVLGARIHIEGVDEKRSDYDLFRNRVGIFYPSVFDFASYFISTFNSQITSQSSMTFRYYVWDNPSENVGTEMHTIKLNYDNYKLYYGDTPLTPERMVTLGKCWMAATIENGDGKAIPWIDGLYIGRREVDPETYDEIGPIERLKIEDNDFKSLIYDWLGSFDHFNRGRMVYSVPILHNTTAEKAGSTTYRPKIGDYGVARNTWYSLAVERIDNLGNPVDDPDQKIIPYISSLENSIMVEIKVLDWHGFSTDVNLPSILK